MEPSRHTLTKILFQLSRPWLLLVSILPYALGVGIVIFLAEPVNWSGALTGWLIICLLLLSSSYLRAYYDYPDGISRQFPAGAARFPRNSILLIVISLLTAGAVLTITLVAQQKISPTLLLFLGIGFLISFFYGVPPVQLSNTGYGEIALAVFMANIIPGFAYSLQTGNVHQLLAMTTFPITALWLAMDLALGLEGYWKNVELGKRYLLIRLGWDNGMKIHNILIFSTYILLLSSRALGMPWALTWPALLTLPIGMYQVWQMQQIRLGSKPRWKVLRFIAVSTTVLMIYLFAYTLWTV